MKVLLLDNNRDYGKHFMYTAQNAYGERVQVLYTEDIQTAKSLLEREKPDVVLTDSSFPWLIVRSGLKIYLQDKPGAKEKKGVPVLHKYQRFGELLGSIEALYGDYQSNPEKYPPETKTAEVITFISAAGGTGKSTLALAYARRMASAGENVLLFSLESYSSLPMVFRCDGEKTLTHALTDVTAEDYMERVESLIQRELKGVYYLEPVAEPLNDNTSTMEKMRYLIEALKGMELFDKIVIELGDSCLSISAKLMEMANRIMLVTSESDVAFYKTSHMLSRYMQDEQWADVLQDKITLLVNRAHMNMPVSRELQQIKKKYQISDCGKYRIAKAVELLTPQMQILEKKA